MDTQTIAGKDWTIPIKGIIHVPDELDPLINKVATQIRFHTIAGKSEAETVCHIVSIAQDFFKKMYNTTKSTHPLT